MILVVMSICVNLLIVSIAFTEWDRIRLQYYRLAENLSNTDFFWSGATTCTIRLCLTISRVLAFALLGSITGSGMIIFVIIHIVGFCVAYRIFGKVFSFDTLWSKLILY